MARDDHGVTERAVEAKWRGHCPGETLKRLVAALCLFAAHGTECQLYDAHECGSPPVNWAKAQISALDPADPQAADRFEQLLDLYWTDPWDRWCSPTGQANTGWGHDKGLMYFALYDLGRVYRELEWSGVAFSADQTRKLQAVFADAVQLAASGTYYYYGKCNLYGGKVNIDNSCGEDDESISKFLAMIHNLFPEMAQSAGGGSAVASLERAFFEKAFSTDYEHGGGLLVADGEVTFPNHGGASWPYAGINLIGANGARDTYLIAGNPFPDWYGDANARELFGGLQRHAMPDGSAFTANCVLNNGTAVACDDPGIMNAVPGMVPAGRFVRAAFGDGAFAPGLYTFERCDLAAISLPDRVNEYCSWNPGTVPLEVLTAASSPSVMDLRWLGADGAHGYEVWWLGARVATGITDTSYAFESVPCGTPLEYAVFARGDRGRTLGGEWGTTSVECTPSQVRRRLQR